MQLMRAFVVVLCFVATVAFENVARADDERFERLVTDATTAFGQGDFEQAIALAEQAYAIRRDPQLLYNIARAHEARGNLEPAMDHYRRFLEAAPETKNRDVVKGRILALATTLAERLRLEGERLEAKGERVGARAAYEKYLAALPEARDREEILGRIRELEKRAPTPPRLPADHGRVESGVNVWPWATIGVGVAVVGMGGLFAVLSRNKYDDAERASDGASTVALQRDADRYTDFANIGFVAGSVIVAGGVTWLLLHPAAVESKTRPRVSLRLGVSHASILGRF
jgi:tetratricopeptide (TPR) repeat protein